MLFTAKWIYTACLRVVLKSAVFAYGKFLSHMTNRYGAAGKWCYAISDSLITPQELSLKPFTSSDCPELWYQRQEMVQKSQFHSVRAFKKKQYWKHIYTIHISSIYAA